MLRLVYKGRRYVWRVALMMPRDAQLGWERGQLDTLLNANRSVNGARPAAACAATPEASGLVPCSVSAPCLHAPPGIPDNARATPAALECRLPGSMTCACVCCWSPGRSGLARCRLRAG